VEGCGISAVVAAALHVAQTDAKAIAWGSARRCKMSRRISTGRSDQLGSVKGHAIYISKICLVHAKIQSSKKKSLLHELNAWNTKIDKIKN
jgi:hypothetical protein